jgi:outer membrane protein
MKIKCLSLFIVILSIGNIGFSQNKWSLESCVNYALENNFTIKKQLLALESKKVELSASKMNVLPSVYGSVGQDLSFGRAAAANGLIENNSQSTTTLGVSLNLPLFEGLKNYYQVASDKLELTAIMHDFEQAKENIELNIASYYLQVLLYKEMLLVAQSQVQLSESQVARIDELVKNGKSSDSELYTAKATLSSDRVSLAEAENNLRLAKLDLAQLMNVTDTESFDIADDAGQNNIDEYLDQNIDLASIKNNALQNRPGIKAAAARIAMSEKDIKIARSGWYPTLSLAASYGTGYYYVFQNSLLASNLPFNTQLNNNSREIVSLSLSIPIFDQLSTYHNVKLSKISLMSQEIELEETKVNILKEIEQAYTNAVAAREKYTAAQASVDASRIAFQYEEVKYNSGASTNYEYNDAKIKHVKSQSELIQSKFDFLFRLKILEYYGK